MRKARNLLVICSALISLSAAAQTIRPVLSEYRTKAEGRFEIVNDMFVAANVVLEAKGFTVDAAGAIQYTPLDPSIKLKLSEKSFRLQPKGSRTVTYTAAAEKLPAWFVIYADIAGSPVKKTSGLNVQIMLPHTVYILPNEDAKKEELNISSATYDAATHTLAVNVASSSANFARVDLALVKTNDGEVDARGFPIFPNSKRRVDIPLEANKIPEKVTLQFEKFKLEADVSRP
jgi:hypothetical protein